LMAMVVATVAPRYRPDRDSAVCESNLKDLTRSVLTYAQDFDDHLPPASDWVAALEQHGAGSLPAQCPTDLRPAADGARVVSYAMPPSLSGLSLSQAGSPDGQMAIFDAEGLRIKPRHAGVGGGVANAGFLDGHVAQVAPAARP